MLLKINLCGDKDKSFEINGHQELCRMAHLGSHSTANLDIPYSCSIFYNFHRNKVLNFFVFFYPRDSVRSPDAKKDSEVRHWYVSLIVVEHEVKPTSMKKFFKFVFYEFYTLFPTCF